jgi:hypothetical protein
MSQTEYIDGYIYHMVHIKNLPGIFKARALFPLETLRAKKIGYFSIAYDDVQELRDRVFVWDSTQQKYLNLHRYVPFYFAIRPPMLYSQHNKNNQEQIVFLEVQRAIISRPDVLFTDGNAATQKLSRGHGETVWIVPATEADGICQRQYMPDGRPYGKGANCSDFYRDATFLSNLNWRVINELMYMDDRDEFKRTRSAEVLIPDQVPLQTIRRIAVYSNHTRNMVNQIKRLCGIAESLLPVVVAPELFI